MQCDTIMTQWKYFMRCSVCSVLVYLSQTNALGFGRVLSALPNCVCTFQACPHLLPGSFFFSCHMRSVSPFRGSLRAFTTSKCNKGFRLNKQCQPLLTYQSRSANLTVKLKFVGCQVQLKIGQIKSNNLMLCRSTGTLNRGPNAKQKISFSRKFPFMKSRERLNKLDDDESFENGSNHRWILFVLPCFKIFTPLLHPFHTLFSLLSDISEK